MRLPSFQLLAENAFSVIKRFPLEFFTAVAGTFCMIMLTGTDMPTNQEWFWVRHLLTCLVALPSFIAVNISASYRHLSMAMRIAMYAVVLLLICWYFISINQHKFHANEMIRFAMLFLAAHLLVACAGFLGRGTTHAFWQYNRILFLRIITSAIFSGVLALGLMGAFAALNELFKLHLDSRWLPRIFFTVIGIFNTLIFLHGVPEDADELEQDNSYPKILSFFTRFVLLPLVIIYFAILLAYELKIVGTWQLPNGWVSNLIIAFTVVGILAILLVYPIRLSEEHTWIKIFSKWFYILLLPLIALMFVAIGKRISDYGFTEERLLVLITSCWMLLMAIYFLWNPHGDIRIIPASLAITAIVMQFVIFPVCRTNQQIRLRNLLAKNDLLKNGVAQKAGPNQVIPKKDAENIQSIVHYLANVHGNESLHPIIGINVLSDKMSAYEISHSYLEKMGYMRQLNRNDFNNFLSAQPAAIDISGFQAWIPIMYTHQENSQDWQAWGSDDKIVIMRNSSTRFAEISINHFIDSVLDNLPPGESQNQFPQQKLIFDTTVNQVKLRIVFKSIQRSGGNTEVRNGDGFVLIKEN